ncbi:MAG: SDR family NAD(P)-dependent oxidoreductase [Pseudomonadota bacterium]
MDKLALVTGATSGIGQSLSNQARQAGYKLLGVGRDFKKSNLAASEQLSIDLSDLDALSVSLGENRVRFADLELLILNAGFGQFGAIEQFSHADIQRVINTNLTANLIILSSLVPILKSKGRGSIVIVGSESALQGAKQGSVYCASKFGLRGLAQSIRAECANQGIQVMLVNPGPVRTPFFDNLEFAPRVGNEFALDPDQVSKQVFAALEVGTGAVVEELNIQPQKRVFDKK